MEFSRASVLKRYFWMIGNEHVSNEHFTLLRLEVCLRMHALVLMTFDCQLLLFAQFRYVKNNTRWLQL